MRKLFLLNIFLCLLLVAIGCEKKSEQAAENAEKQTEEVAAKKVQLVATTTMLADMAEELTGEVMDVKSILTPGTDPHLYKPKPSDAALISSSQVVLTNGFHLEGWIDRLVENAGGEKKVFIVAVEGQEPRKMEGENQGLDPHFWFDLERWKEASRHVARELQRLPSLTDEQKREIGNHLSKYTAEIEKTDAWAREQLATIPEKNRMLVTAHDAFGYFGLRYNIPVHAIQGMSTEQQASPRDVANMIDLVKENSLPAVFIESSINPDLVKQVSSETNAKAFGPLYSDSLGAEGSGADTFLSMFRKNIELIVDALGGKVTPYSDDAKE